MLGCRITICIIGQPFCFDADFVLLFDLLCSVMKANIKALVIFTSVWFLVV